MGNMMRLHDPNYDLRSSAVNIYIYIYFFGQVIILFKWLIYYHVDLIQIKMTV